MPGHTTPAGNSVAPAMGEGQTAGRRGTRKGPSAKALKRVLKGHGLKTTGKKAALTRRAKQAKLVKKIGGTETGPSADVVDTPAVNAASTGATGTTGTEGGRRRKSRGKKYFF